MKTPGIIFLHGAGLGSFIWDEILPLFPNPVLAIDFPNRLSPANANDGLSLADYAHDAVKKIEAWKQDSFVIVAHSIGGCVGLKIAKHFPSRVIGFVGVSAAIPKNGRSFVSVFSFPKRILLPLLLKAFGTRPPDKAIAHDLCNDLSLEQTDLVVKSFTAESKALYLDKCYANIPKVQTLYISCTRDKSFPVSVQTKMSRNLKAKKVVAIESGHLPMLSHHKAFAKILQDFLHTLKQD